VLALALRLSLKPDFLARLDQMREEQG